MGKCIAIGEMLIDFAPNQVGCEVKDVESFSKIAGGAPMNVAICVAKMGIESIMLSKVGEDGFGEYLLGILEKNNVNKSYVMKTKEANTGLAFVSLKENGEREFVFYRKPSADLLYSASEVPRDVFCESDILHFCSVDLVDYPMRKAHMTAIQYARSARSIVSFDPNIRLSLWDNHDEYRKIIQEFLSYADILKVSDDELYFITEIEDEQEALKFLLNKGIKILVYTKGGSGAEVYTSNGEKYFSMSYLVNPVDTTGAGDSFIGSFLAQILAEGLSQNQLLEKNYREFIDYSNATAAIVVSRIGASSSIPSRSEVEDFIKRYKYNLT